MKRITLPAISLLAPPLLFLSACDGPAEQSGEVADNASGAVESEDTTRSGPAETMGERQDEVNESAASLKESQAEALEDQAEAHRDSAAQKAEALEQQAEQVRAQ